MLLLVSRELNSSTKLNQSATKSVCQQPTLFIICAPNLIGNMASLDERGKFSSFDQCSYFVLNNLQKMLTLTGTCSELPIGKSLQTETQFPIKKGSEVFVDCSTGFTLTSGDRTITCVKDAEYTSNNRLPSCTIGKSWNDEMDDGTAVSCLIKQCETSNPDRIFQKPLLGSKIRNFAGPVIK